MEKQKLVEVARSFSYKLNAGNFESRDFFCSQKAEVPQSEAEKTSEALYEFCKNEVLKSVNSYLKEKRDEVAKRGEEMWDEKKQEIYNQGGELEEIKRNN